MDYSAIQGFHVILDTLLANILTLSWMILAVRNINLIYKTTETILILNLADWDFIGEKDN